MLVYTFDDEPTTSANTDVFFMKEALRLAKIAFDENEVPIGALIVLYILKPLSLVA